MLVVDERLAPRGMLTVTAPVAAGEDVLRALLDTFIERHRAVSIRLQLLDHPVSLIEKG